MPSAALPAEMIPALRKEMRDYLDADDKFINKRTGTVDVNHLGDIVWIDHLDVPEDCQEACRELAAAVAEEFEAARKATL